MRRIRIGAGLAVVLAIGLIGPAAAQGPAVTQVVGGLDSPRGLAVATDGTIYVAEAGSGGTEPCLENPELGTVCFGATGGISAIKDGTATRVVDGLASGGTATGEFLGPSGVAVGADGTVWFTVGGPAVGAAGTRDSIPDGAGAGLGQLYRIAADGSAESVADLAAFETSDNPDADQPGNAEPDSNLWNVAASDAGAVVTDAGGNDVLLVAPDGTISVLAVLPVTMMAAPPDPAASPDPNASPAMVPMDPVPTGVAVDADGTAYVGQLTGFPFPVGGASVFRVVAGQEPTVYASGFTNVVGVAFGPDGTLYVLEIAHDGLLAAFAAMSQDPTALPQGALWRVPAGGGDPELITAEGLPFPGGLAVGADGTVYVSTCASCPPDAGAVVSLTP
jgi:hypothetical protein